MIKIIRTAYGLRKGQQFKEMIVDGELTILKSAKRIAMIPTKLITSELIREEQKAA